MVAVLDSLSVPAWAAQILQDIKAANFAELTSIAFPDKGSCRKGSAHKRNSALFGRYLAWDKSHHFSELDPLSPVDLSAELAEVPVAEWPSFSADVVLWLSSCVPAGLPSEAARFGVWFYQVGNEAYFQALYQRQPVTSSRWVIFSEPAAVPDVAAEQFTAVEQNWSVSKAKEVSYWKASALLMKSLRQQQEGSAPTVQVPNRNDLRPDPPHNTRVVHFFIKNAQCSLYRRIRYFDQDGYWFMAYRTDRTKFLSQTEKFQPHGFTVIPAPDGHFYADPFVCAYRGRNYLFFEDYPYKEGKGVISVLEMDERGPVGKARRVLERSYHLSYPFIFEHEGNTYMIPETLEARRIELYRASHFPDGWELVAVLKEDVAAVDTTLWVENGIFYFFTSVADKGVTPNDFLHLFCTNSLTGEWHPHPNNPLNSDVRNSRAAGKLFKRGGKLIRPAQDCSVRYGYACQLNEVQTLSPERYREVPLFRIEPNWMPGLIGTHTINSNDSIEVIDGQIYRKKFKKQLA